MSVVCRQPTEGKTRQFMKMKSLFFGGYSILEEGQGRQAAVEVRHLHRNSSASNSSKLMPVSLCLSVCLCVYVCPCVCVCVVL